MHGKRTQASLLACVFYYTIKAEREVKEMDYYNNPYMARYQNLQMPEMFRGQITRVNGRNGAEAFRMAQNSSALLLDENDPIVWLATTDGSGYKTLTPYTITPYQPAPPVDVNSLENRIKRLEEIVNAKPDIKANDEKQSD